MIPMLDLIRQQAGLSGELERAVSEVISEAQYISLEDVTAFESKLAAFCARKHAVGVSSGTMALQIALLAAEILPGDEIITVPNSFFATTEAILAVGAVPRFVDVDPQTHLMTATGLPSLIQARTRAILPVHLFGNVVNVAGIVHLLKEMEREDIRIIEDCAHAMGSLSQGKPVPLHSIGCFSFNPGKNLGGVGDGGAIVTDDPQIAETARLLRDHGRRGKYHHVLVGFNARMSRLHDRVLALKIDHLRDWNLRRSAHASRYDKAFRAIGALTPLSVSPGTFSSRHQYVIRTRFRDQIQALLRDEGVMTSIHYPRLIVEQPALRKLGFDAAQVPVAARLNTQLLSLPCFPELDDTEVSQVINSTKKAFNAARAANRISSTPSLDLHRRKRS